MYCFAEKKIILLGVTNLQKWMKDHRIISIDLTEKEYPGVVNVFHKLHSGLTIYHCESNKYNNQKVTTLNIILKASTNWNKSWITHAQT